MIELEFLKGEFGSPLSRDSWKVVDSETQHNNEHHQHYQSQSTSDEQTHVC